MARIQTKDIQVEVASKGAELQSIVGRGGLEYLWQGDPAFWSRRSPLLFPIVGALPGGAYAYGGKTYKMGNHGFVRNREFRLAASSGDSLRFELESDAESLAIYPFRFKLAVEYSVRGSTLKVGYEVSNADAKTMHFSIGAHPAFRAPIEAGGKRGDYELVFEKRETIDRYLLTPDNVGSGETERFLDGQDRIALSGSLFEKGAVVLKEHKSRKVTLRGAASGRFVELSFPGFTHLGIWSPKDNAAGECPFVCIEPWYGVMPRAGSSPELEEKEAVLHLEPAAVFRSAYEVRVG